MVLRRILRFWNPARLGLRTMLAVVLVLLSLHTGFLLLVRKGFLVPAPKRHSHLHLEKQRDVAVTFIGRMCKASVDEASEKWPSEQARKRVDLHDVVENLTKTNDSAGDGEDESRAKGAGDGGDESKAEGEKAGPSQRAMVKDSANQTNPQSAEKVQEELTQKDCIRYISIYTPRMQPFRYWREYVNLKEGFRLAKIENSKYYDKRITQRREFPTMFIECPGHHCDVALRPTADQRFLARSDAVMINVAPQESRYKMPAISQRMVNELPRRVKVIFYAMESPLMMSMWDHTIKNIKYHYSMTYHTSSDIFFPYGRYIPGEPMDTTERNFAENKTSLLVWTASNCDNTFWPRTEWVRTLEKLLTFDTYGKCGKKTCLPPLSPNCTRQQAVYKFYLALENAPCDEYISEKFWINSLQSGLVPVVYGGTREAYERVAPPNSFIHVGDFSSTQGLVDYLQMLDKNDKLYNEFFAWRRQGRVEKIYPNLYPGAFCRVLPKLSKYSTPPARTIGDSPYFQGCQGGAIRNMTKPGDITNWTPWR